jgi:hypothetical protein
MNANVAELLAAYFTGERWMAKDTSQRDTARDEVARLAYHLYEVRGRQDGHDVEDWLLAEDRIRNGSVARSRYATAPTDSDGGRT